MGSIFVFQFNPADGEWGSVLNTGNLDRAIDTFIGMAKPTIWKYRDVAKAVKQGVPVEVDGFAILSINHCTQEQFERYCV